MSVTDPIADMLTCIRNAAQAKHPRVDVPASRVKEEVVKLLEREKFIKNYRRIEDGKQGVLRVYLKYDVEAGSIISHLKRISKPGLRVYAAKTDIPRVLGGLGVVIVSTSQGIMTGQQARKGQLGGEILAYVW